MAFVIQIKRRIGGTDAPPASGNVGELAIRFPGAAGDSDQPELWANDGQHFRLVNPPDAPAPDLTPYLQKAGGTMTQDAGLSFAVPLTAPIPAPRIDGTDATKSAITNFTIDMGEF